MSSRSGSECRSWPCQRLRLGAGALLFFFFEITWGKQLPPLLTFALLGIGIASLVSAWSQLKLCRLELQLDHIREAWRLPH